MDQFIVFAMAAATMAVEDSGWAPEDEEEPRTHRLHDRLRHRRAARHHRRRDHAAGERAAPDQPVLHPVQPDQPRLRQRLDQLRLQGPEPRGGDRLLDRRACDRRRGAADHARRCRRHGLRRRRGGGLPAWGSPASPRRGRCRPRSTTTRRAPRGRGTRTATAL